jgi:TRAP transporter TAXI family solute receptor
MIAGYPNQVKKYVFRTATLTLIGVFFASLFVVHAYSQGSTVYLKIAAGAPGTSYYAFSAPMGQLIDRYSKNPKIQTTVSTSGGGMSNLRFLVAKETDIATTQAGNAWKYSKGMAPFEKKADLRAVLAGEQCPYFFVVPADSPIKTISDVAGKRITPGDPGGGTQDLMKEMFRVLGIKYQESDIVYMPHGEGKDALADGKVDAWFTFLSSNVDALAAVKKVRIVSFSDSDVKRITEGLPFVSKIVFPEGVVRGVGRVTVISMPSIWVVRPDMDANLVYQIVKIICEHKEVIQKSQRNSREFDAEFAANSTAIPYHEGAVRYYKEVGAM